MFVRSFDRGTSEVTAPFELHLFPLPISRTTHRQ